MPQRWDDPLRAEHRLLERIIDLLDKEIQSLQDEQVHLTRISKIFNLLLDFGDKIHNVKEENHLFPTMIERGIPQAGHIHKMLLDHEAERELIAHFLLKVSDFEQFPREEKNVLIKKIQEYTATRREHIQQENQTLYPLADQVLTAEDNDKLLRAFDIIDRDVYGEEALQHYTAITDHLQHESDHFDPPISKLSQEQLHSIFEALPCEVTFIDENDNILFFNKMQTRKMHILDASAIGRQARSYMPAQIKADYGLISEQLRTGARDKISFWFREHDRLIYTTFVAAKAADGRFIGLLEICQDITSLKNITGEKVTLQLEESEK